MHHNTIPWTNSTATRTQWPGRALPYDFRRLAGGRILVERLPLIPFRWTAWHPKDLLAMVIATEADLNLVFGSLVHLQSMDQAHRGTTPRAMRNVFKKAKAIAMTVAGMQRGSLLLIDEIDGFLDRSGA